MKPRPHEKIAAAIGRLTAATAHWADASPTLASITDAEEIIDSLVRDVAELSASKSGQMLPTMHTAMQAATAARCSSRALHTVCNGWLNHAPDHIAIEAADRLTRSTARSLRQLAQILKDSPHE